MAYASVEYYSALKMKKILTHAATWINFEDIMPSVISQSSHSKIVGQLVSFKKLEYKIRYKNIPSF